MADWEDFTQKFLSLPMIIPKEDEEITHYYEGVKFLKVMPASALKEIRTFEVRSDDIYLISYPKAGTTWMQQIVSQIVDGEKENNNQTHLFFKFPFLEITWVNHHSQIGLIPPSHKILESMPSPRMIKTHLPSQLLPQQIFERKPKILYIARNPKDVLVSYYHFHNTDVTLPTYKTWDDFFQDFISGDVAHGPWFEHNLFWWQHRHDPNVLFLKYEDMKHDLKGAIIQVADYLGRTFPDDVLDKMVEKCTFKSMKKNPACNPDSLGYNIDDIENGKKEADIKKEVQEDQQTSFLRKGTVGDWRNHFTVAQNDIFDKLYTDKMSGSDLVFDFGS
ncbi:sulfotransferase 1A1-like [Amphiura filiformis]|uniref:sulfotransferase 1A1-like n=1 Tax=Amphiura filiformis TaxID=82378 RepID=UPI003B225DC8